MDDKPKFENYKQEQNYWNEKYKNRGKTIWVSKKISRDGKVLEPGRTYEKPKERIVHKTMKDVE
jgi:hypothetical protein